jgi:hypothetical protein
MLTGQVSTIMKKLPGTGTGPEKPPLITGKKSKSIYNGDISLK